MSFEPPVRPDRDVVVVEGADAATFLQGQLSQDVAALAVRERSWSFLLQPQGKVVAWLGVVRVSPTRFELEVDEGWAEEVVARLRRFLLRVDVDVSLGVPRRVGDATERDRIAARVPAMGAELTAEVIPAELGRSVVDASVSFTKGCYTGQELVARVDSRGSNTPRHLRLIELDGEVAAGSPVVADGAEVGRVTSVADGLALAFISRKVSLADGPVAAIVDGVAATIHPDT